MFVETSGSRWSSDRITTRPFGRVYFSNLIVGRAISVDLFAVLEAGLAGAFWGGDFFGASWPKTGGVATAMDMHKISKRFWRAEVIPILLGDCPTLYQTQSGAIALHPMAKHSIKIPQFICGTRKAVKWNRLQPVWFGLEIEENPQAEACSTVATSVVLGAGKAYDSRERNPFQSEAPVPKGLCHEERCRERLQS